MVYKFLNKKQSGGALRRIRSENLTARDKSANKIGIKPNQLLAKELYKPIIRKFEKQLNLVFFQRQYLGCWSVNAINR